MIKKRRDCIVLLGLLIYVITTPVTAQEKEITLSGNLSGSHTYTARDAVRLKPGFSHRATAQTYFTGKIDPTLVFPPSEHTYADENGNIVGDSSLGAVVGNLSGTFNASPTGAATYSIPVGCPPGINGMQPKISLAYNSQSGNGIAGMCWGLSGLSMISRAPKNHYFDKDCSGIIWEKESPLALDGNRLIEIGRWATDSVEYRTETGLDRIVGYQISETGPQFFKVYTRDGLIMQYGGEEEQILFDNKYYALSYANSPVALIVTRNANMPPIIELKNLGWFLVKVTDLNGNYIRYNYTATDWRGQTSPTRIDPNIYFSDNRIDNIEYGNGDNRTGSIHFDYTPKVSSHTQYIDGIEIKSQKKLSKIRINDWNDSLLETYELSYLSQDGNDFLAEVKRSDSSGEFIHPLKVEWKPMSYTHELLDRTTFSPTPNIPDLNEIKECYSPTAYGDINGDGLTDVLLKMTLKDGNHYWVLYRNLGNGHFQFVYEEKWDKDVENVFLFMDRNNDGRDELYVGRASNFPRAIFHYSLDCYEYVDNTNEFRENEEKRIKSLIPYSLYEKRKELFALPGNFSGSGKPQVIICSGGNKPELYFNGNGSSFSTCNPGFGGKSKSKIVLTDINGNGKTEIMYIDGSTTGFYEYDAQTGNFESIHKSTLFAYNDDLSTGDFNGDGCTDILALCKSSPKKWKLFLSKGDGNFIEKDMNSEISNTLPDAFVTVLDVNQDGKSDILVNSPISLNWETNDATLKLLLNTGDGFTTKILSTTFPSKWTFSMASNFRSFHSKEVYRNYSLRDGGRPGILSLCKDVWFNKVKAITDSFGETLEITYRENKISYSSRIQGNSKDDDGNSGEKTAISTSSVQLEVVGRVYGKYLNNYYRYSDAEVHLGGRGFLGFKRVECDDRISNITETSESRFHDSYKILYPYKTIVNQGSRSGPILSEVLYEYTFGTWRPAGYPFSGLFYMNLKSQKIKDHVKNTEVTTTYTYTSSPDFKPRTIKTDYGDGVSRTESYEYAKAGSDFFNRIKYRNTKYESSGQPVINRSEHFFYDDRGNLLQHTRDSLHSQKVQVFYSGYDRYGNPGKVVTKADNRSRSKTMTYTGSGRFVKTVTDDRFGETTSYDYDESRGLLRSKSDRLGTTHYEYDHFGRLRQTTYPDGIREVAVLQWAGRGAPAGAKYYSYSELSGQSPVKTWHDSQGREIRRESFGLNNKKTVVNSEYETKTGRLKRVSEPYFEGDSKIWASEYTYDAYGRIRSVKTPLGTSTYSYDALTTLVETPTGSKETTVNGAGWTVWEKTNGERVDFVHYSNGQLKSATPAGGTSVSMRYDIQGNRIELIDPDAGTISSAYNAWGELTEEKQAVHNATQKVATKYYYHPNGLVDYKTVNAERTDYQYDDFYRLKRIAIAGKSSQSFRYDDMDRIVEVRDSVEAGKIFTRTTEYDRLGRVQREYYPSGYPVLNFYDNNGYLTEVKSGDGSFSWKALESNARGQLTKTRSGAKETVYSYDTKGFPESMVTDGILNISYHFSGKYYNLNKRKDNLSGYEEQFKYDDLNRLTDWTIRRNSVILSTRSQRYSGTNISSKDDFGSDLQYGEENNKPHALTSFLPETGSNFSAGQQITYTDFKKVKTVTEGNNHLAITYGVDQQRIKSLLTTPSGTVTRYYLGGYEEEEANGKIRKIHYLSGGNGLAAVFIRNSDGRDSLFYAHTDYQGSLIALSLPDGSVKEKYAYDPWGKRRDPDNWTLDDSRTSFLLNRGYTMHEHLPAFHLIDMNGRMYDPGAGLFLSPDPYIQTPDNWLNYNRYSYCMNNPMRYVDPTGEFAWFIPVIIGAVVGAYTGASIQSGTAAFWDWKPNAWQGAIAGGLIGAAAGGLFSAAFAPGGLAGATATSSFQATGMITDGVASAAWGTTSSILNSASINIGMNAISGGGWDGAWKAGLVGAATGGWTATGGFGMVKGFGSSNAFAQLGGKLGYQMVGTAGSSIGNNWAAGKKPFSQVSLGVGPVNLTLGKGQKLLQWQNNLGNIAMNSFGLSNLMFGGKVNFDWKNLSLNYRGGIIDKFYPPGIWDSGFGAHAVIGNSNLGNLYSHELHHLWQSRSLGDLFLLNYGLQGIGAMSMGGSFLGNYNYFETQADGGCWW